MALERRRPVCIRHQQLARNRGRYLLGGGLGEVVNWARRVGRRRTAGGVDRGVAAGSVGAVALDCMTGLLAGGTGSGWWGRRSSGVGGYDGSGGNRGKAAGALSE